MTLLEAPDVLNVDNADLRRVLCSRVSDEMVRHDWTEFAKWPRSEKIALVESSRNRIRRLVQSDAVRRMIGQRNHALDVRRVIDNGQILLANIGNVAAPETQRLLGALVVNAIFHAAKQRDSKRRRDYFVIIDEAGQFATRDLANSLDELRKAGCHFIIAHQRLAQLDREDRDILSSVLTNAKVRVVFGGLERLEAERMARELFTGEVRGDHVKHVSVATKFRPVFDTFEVETETWSDSDGESESSGVSRSVAEGNQLAESAVYATDDETSLGTYADDDIVSRTLGQTVSGSSTSTESSSRSVQRSHSQGGSRSLVPITRHEEFREETGRTFYGVDEQWEAFTAAVHRLGKREALVRIHNGPVLHVRTADVAVDADDHAIRRFKDTVLSRCPNVQSARVVAQEIEERRRRMATVVDEAAAADRPFNVNTFKE